MKDAHKTEYLLERLGAIAVPGFIAIIATLAILDIRAVFEPRSLLFILNAVFISIIPFVVAYIAARSYLTSGSPGSLFLGCGVLAFGSAGLLAG